MKKRVNTSVVLESKYDKINMVIVLFQSPYLVLCSPAEGKVLALQFLPA